MRSAQLRSLTLAGLMLLAVSGCSGGEKSVKSDEAHGDSHGDTHGQADAHGGTGGAKLTHWAYSGDEGPSHWAQLGGDAATCASGARQSPIDLTGSGRPQMSKITLDYLSSNATIQNDGHSIKVVPSKGGGLIADGTQYDLKQIHFHSPSEHTINGRRAALESHFVHQNTKGEYLVVAVLSNVGVADPMLAPIWTYLPSDQTTPAAIPDLLINARDLMPAAEEFFVYSGSLTVPPCSEGVTWMVFSAPLSVSPEQVSAYETLLGSTARPIQARKDRDVLTIISAG
ncbi:carbonic anhydrase [Asticcacaulis machinosus]|uniref:carbonic anhydrase n=1 Tax=Asticcacaulis machinosus TaxID=2984211 RepID=A0ABT5HG93_9CAUL|nr:carbonic anhydrase family protein [Asticcacaulis machinosus]MDC7675008.1 carbonic anhydrase family protein [Asticcacaulis machinosus]